MKKIIALSTILILRYDFGNSKIDHSDWKDRVDTAYFKCRWPLLYKIIAKMLSDF
jgi:hypothetical protein